MTDREPVEVKNLDRYGSPPIPWSMPRDLVLAAQAAPPEEVCFFLNTVRPDGRPHSAGIGAIWVDSDFYFTTSPQARKGKDLQANPNCTLAIHLKGVDVVFEGAATRITDQPTLQRIAKTYSDGGWPAEVEGDAFTAPFNAPSAGAPPYWLYHFVFHTAFGVGNTQATPGATRWRFAT